MPSNTGGGCLAGRRKEPRRAKLHRGPDAKPYPCKFCPVGCHRKIKITEPGEYALEAVGPEYETLGMMGTNLMISDPKAVSLANDIANRLGIDTISAGAMVGFAMECFERGWITARDTGGVG